MAGAIVVFDILMVMKIYILDGIGTHDRPDGIVMKQVADAIKERTDISETKWVNWPASMLGQGGPLSWNQASAIGVQMLTDEVSSNNEDFILLAFSGGNKPARDWLYANKDLRKRCKAVGLLSDPERPHDRWQSGTDDPGGWGIAGEDYGPVPDMTFWTSYPGDAISSARKDALLRSFNDITNTSPEFAVKGANITLANVNKFQLGYQLEVPFFEWFTSLGRRINEAIGDVHRYLNGWHTTKYTISFNGGLPLTTRLGSSIAWRINNPPK